MKNHLKSNNGIKEVDTIEKSSEFAEILSYKSAIAVITCNLSKLTIRYEIHASWSISKRDADNEIRRKVSEIIRSEPRPDH